MSLATVAHVRALVTTALADDSLQTVIDREEAELVRRYGAHGDGSTAVTEIHEGGLPSIWLRRKAVSITSITETYVGGTSPTTLVSTDYYRWAGRSQLIRLPAGTRWGYSNALTEDAANIWQPLVTVVYVPEDDRDLRRQVIIELVRIAVEQTSMKSESFLTGYEYQAPNWSTARAQQYRRLGYVSF